MIMTTHLVGDPAWASVFALSPNLTKVCLETFLQGDDILYDMHVHYFGIDEEFSPEELTEPVRSTLLRLWEEEVPEAFRDDEDDRY